MGLDICIHRFRKVEDPKKTYRSGELPEGMSVKVLGHCSEMPDKPKFEGLGEDYVFRCIVPFFSYEKMLASKGKDINDGWEWCGEGSCPWGISKEEEEELLKDIPEDQKDCMWFVGFHRKDSDERVWVCLHDGTMKSFEVEDECWCGMYDAYEEIGYMRKGANSKFYDDEMWDTDKIVCSKEVLKEHMEKYFDEKGNGMYESPRECFRREIYDKFRDGEGMYVVYC